MIAILGRFQATLTPRERLVMEIGLRGAHLEEALAHGELGRAKEHEMAAVKIAQQLAKT